jgi:septal ring factor EnvC (AmiA/AmiB activator)
LTRASSEVDEVLRELSNVARDREAAVEKLEGDLAGLEGREKELKNKIEALQKTPLPVAEHFAKLLESRERRAARRDYLLFGAGVVVTTAIAVALQFFRASPR